MIEIAQLSAEFWERSCNTPGGFCWWYIDLTNEVGDGLVLIWAQGLPFLPGSRSPQLAGERPSLNLALYQAGRTELYLLQEYPAQETCFSSDGSAQLGRSRIAVRIHEQGLVVEVDLNEALPGTDERLVGRIVLQGMAASLPRAGRGVNHVWTPRVLGGHAEAKLRVGRTHWHLQGDGYFDGNASTAALHQQGIDSWRWGRFNIAGQSLVFYDVVPEASLETPGDRFVLERTSASGLARVEGPVLQFGPEKSGLYGVSSPRRLSLFVGEREFACTMKQLVDDGPFYQRYLLGVVSGAERGQGVYEVVRPDRVDLAWQRPFVRMRTHVLGGKNSAWLPLFSGPRSGRTRRLLGSWLHGAGP